MQRLAEVNLNTLAYWEDRHARDTYFDWDIEDLPERIAALIPPDAHVLDVGSAMGWFPRRIKALRDDVLFSAADFSSEALATVAQRYPGFFVELFHWDVRTSWPYDHDRYDVVMCTELLEHLEDPVAAVETLAGIARDRLIVTVPNEARIPCIEHVWSYTAGDLAGLLAPYGTPHVQAARNGTSLIGMVDVG